MSCLVSAPAQRERLLWSGIYYCIPRLKTERAFANAQGTDHERKLLLEDVLTELYGYVTVRYSTGTVLYCNWNVVQLLSPIDQRDVVRGAAAAGRLSSLRV